MANTATAQAILDSANSGLGLPLSQIGFTSTDQTGRQILTMLNDVGSDLCRAHDWQFLLLTATFTGDGVKDTFDLPADYGRAVNQTLWASSDRKVAYGPTSPSMWGWLNYGIEGPSMLGNYRYRVVQNKIQVFPVPADGAVFTFYYICKNWVTGGEPPYTPADEVKNGTDVPVFDKRLITAGCKLRLWGQKGFDTTELTAEFNFLLASEKGVSQGAPVLNLAGDRGHYYIDQFNVPEDSWDV